MASALIFFFFFLLKYNISKQQSQVQVKCFDVPKKIIFEKDCYAKSRLSFRIGIQIQGLVGCVLFWRTMVQVWFFLGVKRI